MKTTTENNSFRAKHNKHNKMSWGGVSIYSPMLTRSVFYRKLLTSLPWPSMCRCSRQCRLRLRKVPSASRRFSWGSQTSVKPKLWTPSHSALISSGKGSPARSRATPLSASCTASASSPGVISTSGRPEASRDRETAPRTCLSQGTGGLFRRRVSFLATATFLIITPLFYCSFIELYIYIFRKTGERNKML